MKPLAPNTLLQNRYLIVQLIGKGGMGEVYLAVDQRLGSAVAVKRTFFSDDEQLGNAFEREARTLARLRHPVLPKVSDHFTEAEMQYLIMEHISGEDISKRLERGGKPFPLSWVLYWADHLLDALTYLHSQEPPVIHRDIKPQNLKLTDENNIILLDFGLAKNTAGETRINTFGSIIGYTPHYAPMEQIRGTGTDARTDVYSLSATLYQILTNIVPADALSRADAVLGGSKDPITPISETNLNAAESISDIISKGMEISQDKRYNSARDMQKALRDAYSKIKSGVSTKVKSDVSTDTAVSANRQPEPKVKPSQIVTEATPTALPVSAFQSYNPQENDSMANQQNPDQKSPSAIKDEKPEQDFDATWRMDTDKQNSVSQPSGGETDRNQSAIETEVLTAGSSPEITAAQKGEYDQKEDFTQKDDFAESEFSAPIRDFSGMDALDLENEKFSERDDFSDVEKFLLDSAIPPPSFSNNQDDIISSEPEVAAPHDDSPAVVIEDQTPVQNPPVPPKSNGKTYALAGGIAALLILTISAAGLVWYVFSENPAVTEEIPASTPEAAVEAEPTAAPTLEAVINANTEESSNSDASIEKETAEANADKTIEQTGKTVRTPITQPPSVRASTPKTGQRATTVKPPPDKKPDVKKTPAKNRSSDILP